jgi:hypothetical protein
LSSRSVWAWRRGDGRENKKENENKSESESEVEVEDEVEVEGEGAIERRVSRRRSPRAMKRKTGKRWM